jgi:adenosylmethionine-8-amino-7-oxononanoate aminotransferase
VNLHGHSHPYIAEKIAEQAKINAHSIFSGFTHPGAIELSERLLKHLPEFSKVFFSDDGSTSVEVAIKMALQYWYNKNKPRKKIIAFADAYHGDTFGSMSIGERDVFTLAFTPLLFEVYRLPLPDAKSIEKVKKELQSYISAGDVAAFIFEPLVLGAGGMKMYEAALLDELIAICKKSNVICIADEVMTGFGRTGKFFAIDHLQNKPDIICLSKGLTGGFMPLGLTACMQFIYDAYVVEDRTKTFFHGHSYTGNPLACAAALASLDLLEKEESWKSIQRIAALHAEFEDRLKSHKKILAVRTSGTILALEIKTSEKSGYMNSLSERIASWFIQQSILLRPLGNVLYVLPPYCITPEELRHIYSSIELFLEREID